MLTTRCTICSKEFTDEETIHAISCPSCGTKNLPCSIKEDVMVKINWHELRILTIWAENWARKIDSENDWMEANMEPFNCLYTVMVIAQRLQQQHTDKIPITLFGEIRKLKEEIPILYPGAGVESNLDDDSKLNI